LVDSPLEGPTGHSRERTESGSGSVVPEGLKRVLYVKNGHVEESVFEDEEALKERIEELGQSAEVDPMPMRGETARSSSVREDGVPAGQEQGGYLLRPAGKDGSVVLVERISLDYPERPFTLSPPATRSPFQVMQNRSRPPTPPLENIRYLAPEDASIAQQGDTTPEHAEEQQPSEQSHTSGITSGSSPSPKRPLPRPPSTSRPNSAFIPSAQSHDSHSASSHLDTIPLLHIPPPPSREPSSSTPQQPPAPDLSLIVASHLLSTQAASLFQHSSNMKEVSEVMYRMARESLDRGNQLLGMAREHEIGPTGARDGNAVPDMTDGSIPGISSGEDDVAQSGYTTPKATQTKEDNLSPVPPRPTTRRIKSISTLNLQSPTPEASHQSHETSTAADDQLDPGIWLSEVARLGRDGWNSLHLAEEAWFKALHQLKDIASQAQSRTQCLPATQDESFIDGLPKRAVSGPSISGISANAPSSGTAYSPPRVHPEVVSDKHRIISRHQSLEHLTSMQMQGVHVHNYQTSNLNLSPPLGYTDQLLGFDGLAAIARNQVPRSRPVSRVSVGRGGRKLSKYQRLPEVLIMPVRLERAPSREMEKEKEREVVGSGGGGSMRSGSVKRRWFGRKRG
jgi:hypothetical protein